MPQNPTTEAVLPTGIFERCGRGQPAEEWDGQQRGLLVRVLPSGRIEFAVRYRIRGKRRRLKLGEYPAVSLAIARKRARKAQSAIDNGEDPARDRQAAKTKPADTVSALAETISRSTRGSSSDLRTKTSESSMWMSCRIGASGPCAS